MYSQFLRLERKKAFDLCFISHGSLKKGSKIHYYFCFIYSLSEFMFVFIILALFCFQFLRKGRNLYYSLFHWMHFRIPYSDLQCLPFHILYTVHIICLKKKGIFGLCFIHLIAVRISVSHLQRLLCLVLFAILIFRSLVLVLSLNHLWVLSMVASFPDWGWLMGYLSQSKETKKDTNSPFPCT